MIRVLHFVPALTNGGVEHFIMNMYRNIDREKIQFDFLVGGSLSKSVPLSERGKGVISDEIRELGGALAT